MPKIMPLSFNGKNSLAEFYKELADKHPGQETTYIKPLQDVIKEFEEKGPIINKDHKNFIVYKKIEGNPYKGIGELRTKKCRYFIYKDEPNIYIGLHGFEKKQNETPKSELERARKETLAWKAYKKNLLSQGQQQSKKH